MQRSALPPGRRTDAPSSRTVDRTSGTKLKLKSAIKEPSKACLTQVGPWGGKGGRSYQIEVEPACLNSIMVRSGETIQAIAFSYSDNEGKPHHAGPWGAEGGVLSGCIDTILLGPSEYLIEISGTVGRSTKLTSDVIMSLMFTTNISVYGPFGRGGGIPFRSQLTSNDNIVGFFVRATSLVDAIGIYVKPRREQTKNEALITKIGPWGCHAGRIFDVHVLPQRLVSVVVRCNEVIDSIGFTYSDCDGYQHSAGPWGAYGASPSRDGTIHTIVLGPSELLVEISGTIGPSSDWPDVVTSLLFVTNTGKYGPFGAGGGIPFCSPHLNKGNIVGFFVRSGWHVDSIGVYMNAQKEQVLHSRDPSSLRSDHLSYDMMDILIVGEALLQPVVIHPTNEFLGLISRLIKLPLAIGWIFFSHPPVIYPSEYIRQMLWLGIVGPWQLLLRVLVDLI